MFKILYVCVFFPLYRISNGQYSVIGGLTQQSCIDLGARGSYYDEFDDGDYKIPICTEYKANKPTSCPCPVAYKCNAANRCDVDLGSCMIYHAKTSNYQSTYYTARNKPTCLNDGSWAPKQCKGDNSGRCFCYSGQGKRLFGQAKATDQKDMTCACSRKKNDMVEVQGRPYSSLHCDSIGNFEPLQCDSGLCWCAESKTGELTSKMVPEKNMNRLPCYEEVNVGSEYLRQCESEQYAIATISELFKKHGVTQPNMRTMVCDGDGAFGPYNISNGMVYCTWRDGTVIMSWSSNVAGSLASINCNCARDYKLNLLTLKCDENGNYLALQSTNDGEYFCVDSDGFRKNDNSNEKWDCSQVY